MATRRRNRAPHRVLLALAVALLAGGLVTGCHRGDVARGRAVYERHCTRCHGPNGEGQNPAKPWGSLVPTVEGYIAPALDGRGHCWYHTPDEMFALIKHGTGRPGSTMPAWGVLLRDEDILRVIAYIRSLWPRRLRKFADSLAADRAAEPARENKPTKDGS